MAAEASSPPTEPSYPSQEYWCYHCEKRVPIETQPSQPDDVICSECKFGFVELIPTTTTTTTTASSSAILSPDRFAIPDEPTLGSQFLQVLRLLAQVAPPPPPPPPPRRLNSSDPSPSDDSDFLRIEINGWDEDDSDNRRNTNNNNEGLENENENDDDDEDDVRSVEIEAQSDDNDDDDDDDDEEYRQDREEDIRRIRRDVLRLRLRDFAQRARSEGRNRILDWAEILMGLQDNSTEFRFETTTDRYIGNPGDYLDSAEYEALLQNLADAEGRRGAPPAAKSAVEGLKAVEIKTIEETYLCAICKDCVSVGEFVKEMPCGHGYHGDCIGPWLAARNSCPVCRFELPTEDEEYDEERKKRCHGGSSSSHGREN